MAAFHINLSTSVLSAETSNNLSMCKKIPYRQSSKFASRRLQWNMTGTLVNIRLWQVEQNYNDRQEQMGNNNRLKMLFRWKVKVLFKLLSVNHKTI